MAAGMVTIRVAGIQRWIVGGFTELKFIRGGSEILKNAYESLAVAASSNADSTVVSSSSGALSVYVNGDARSVGNQLGAMLRDKIPDAPVLITYQFDDGTSISERIGLRGYPPSTAICAFSGEAAATGTVTHNKRSIPRGTSIRYRMDAINAMTIPADMTFDIGTIGEITQGRFAGYVAIIVADGDGIGRRVQAAWTDGPKAVRELNLRLKRESEALVDAAYGAGKHLLGDIFRWNPVITGGDDITLVVPAVAAPAIALALSSSADVDDEPGMTASVSVFFCKSSYPFHLAREAAEHVLSEAKVQARATGHPMLDLRFEMGTIADQARWGFKQGPYTRNQFESMVRWAESTHDLSTSSLRHLAEAVSEGGRAATREWQLTTLGSEDDDDPTGLRSVLSAFDMPDSPFAADGRSSPIGDLIDLMSLAAGSPSAASGEAP